MEFKKGDKVRIVDDGFIYLGAEDVAEALGLTKWKAEYGEWQLAVPKTGICQNKTGVVINIWSISDNLIGVEIDNEEVQIVIGSEGLALLQEQSTPDPVQASKRNKKMSNKYDNWKAVKNALMAEFKSLKPIFTFTDSSQPEGLKLAAVEMFIYGCADVELEQAVKERLLYLKETGVSKH
jgi:hypothetical protein